MVVQFHLETLFASKLRVGSDRWNQADGPVPAGSNKSGDFFGIRIAAAEESAQERPPEIAADNNRRFAGRKAGRKPAAGLGLAAVEAAAFGRPRIAFGSIRLRPGPRKVGKWIGDA